MSWNGRNVGFIATLSLSLCSHCSSFTNRIHPQLLALSRTAYSYSLPPTFTLSPASQTLPPFFFFSPIHSHACASHSSSNLEQPATVQKNGDTLNSKQRARLRSIAHRLQTFNLLPILHLSPSQSTLPFSYPSETPSSETTTQSQWQDLLQTIDQVLSDNKLVSLKYKVKKKKMAVSSAEKVAKALQAHIVHVIGHTILLFRADWGEDVFDDEGNGLEEMFGNEAKKVKKGEREERVVESNTGN